MRKINAAEFKKLVRESEGDVFVDFFAEWCGPCKKMEPILEKIAKDETVYQVDIDEEKELAIEYGIMSIPCVISFHNGEEYKRSVGVVSDKKLMALKK